MEPNDIVAEALHLVTHERNQHYGHPLDNFQRTADLWAVILGCEVKPHQVALCMQAVKIAREIESPKLDNIIDGIGYWLTLAMVKNEQIERYGK